MNETKLKPFNISFSNAHQHIRAYFSYKFTDLIQHRFNCRFALKEAVANICLDNATRHTIASFNSFVNAPITVTSSSDWRLVQQDAFDLSSAVPSRLHTQRSEHGTPDL